MRIWVFGSVFVVIAALSGCSCEKKQKAGDPVALSFAAQPGNTTESQTMAPIQVRIVDDKGVLVTSATGDITLDLSANPTGTAFTPITLTAASGIVSFDTVSIADVGAAYSLIATSPNLTDAISSPFDIVANQLPVITSTLDPGRLLFSGKPFSFTVTADDPEGDDLTLSILNPPPGFTFPTVSGPSPLTATGTWRPASSGIHNLTFRASDVLSFATANVRAQVAGTSAPSATLAGDVTGDGIADIVIGAPFHDGNAANTGAVHVFAGNAAGVSGNPTATLVDPAGAANSFVGGCNTGADCSQRIVLADVTGDGLLDVIAGSPDAGADGIVHVWAGAVGLTGTVNPTATLTVAGSAGLSELPGQSILTADVTGDGTLDLVVGAVNAIGGQGAAYVWAGGAGLTGTPAATATLTDTDANAFGSVGEPGQGILFGDVDNDGTLDVIVVTPQADTANTASGGIFVWEGGATLVGTIAADARLFDSVADVDDQVGFAGPGFGQPVLVGDVTGDDIDDIVAIAPESDKIAVDGGAAYVWVGGALAGDTDPTATLQVSTASIGDQLGRTSGQGLFLEDVFAGPTTDIVIGAMFANEDGVVDSGAIYVWTGGGLSGATAPVGTLRVPMADTNTNNRLGFSTNGVNIVFADVAGNSAKDIIVGTEVADLGGGPTADVGAVYVFNGGSFVGPSNPSATLTITSAQIGDGLTGAGGQGLLTGDVTGDGRDDILAVAASANLTAADVGGIWVWAGGLLSGNASVTAVLRATSPDAGDQLGIGNTGADAVLLTDFTGDGTLDVIAASSGADLAGTDRGAIYIWEGGSGLATGNPGSLENINAADGDQLAGGGIGGQNVYAADVSGDGVIDLIVNTPVANNGGTNRGACYVWEGGNALAAGVNPAAVLDAGAADNDEVGGNDGQGIILADVTGDGIPDVISSSAVATGAVSGSGAAYVWTGGAMTGTTSPAVLTDPNATQDDFLGRVQ